MSAAAAAAAGRALRRPGALLLVVVVVALVLIYQTHVLLPVAPDSSSNRVAGRRTSSSSSPSSSSSVSSRLGYAFIICDLARAPTMRDNVRVLVEESRVPRADLHVFVVCSQKHESSADTVDRLLGAVPAMNTHFLYNEDAASKVVTQGRGGRTRRQSKPSSAVGDERTKGDVKTLKTKLDFLGVIDAMFEAYEAVVVVESDLLFSPHAHAYFTWGSRVMALDDSLMCVSAWNDNSFSHGRSAAAAVSQRRRPLRAISSGRRPRATEVGILRRRQRAARRRGRRRWKSSSSSTADYEDVLGGGGDDDAVLGRGRVAKDSPAGAQEALLHSTSSRGGGSKLTAATREPALTFLRGGHFMGLGWVALRSVWRRLVLPAYRERLQDPAWSWDRVLQHVALLYDLECLYPSTSLSRHVGDAAFTPEYLRRGRRDASGEYNQASFDNMVMYAASEPPAFPAPAAMARGRQGYERSLAAVAARADELVCVDAATDFDEAWDTMHGHFGLWGRGFGGQQRGVHRGAVAVRHDGRLLFVVGRYSSYVDPGTWARGARPGDLAYCCLRQSFATASSAKRSSGGGGGGSSSSSSSSSSGWGVTGASGRRICASRRPLQDIGVDDVR